MSGRKYIFYMHPGSANHGSEAVIRASAQILGGEIGLYSADIDQDYRYRLESVVSDIRPCYRRKSADEVRPGDVWLAMDTDNGSYMGTRIFALQNRLLKRQGAKTILWGCTLNEELMERFRVMDDLSRYDRIIVRESFSCRLARRATDRVCLIPDPAFALKPVELPLLNGWQEKNMVGLNADPLLFCHGKRKDMLFEAYRFLIQEIFHRTKCGIALIPHVVRGDSDDRNVLETFYREFSGSGRLIRVPDMDCRELKGYIARCRIFVGARMHALIGAYSACVPALAVGDGMQMRGTAFDLFGTEDGYVMHVQEMERAEELAEQFFWLMERETQVRKHLEKIMPEYIQKAYKAKELLEGI